MSEQGVGEVRPIYRRGDRVLVHLPLGYCEVTVEGCEIEEGRLWLYGVGGNWALRFQAMEIVCRLGRQQVLSWQDIFQEVEQDTI